MEHLANLADERRAGQAIEDDDSIEEKPHPQPPPSFGGSQRGA